MTKFEKKVIEINDALKKEGKDPITWNKISVACGLSNSRYIYGFRDGALVPVKEDAEKIAKFLNVTVEDLFDNVKTPEPPIQSLPKEQQVMANLDERITITDMGFKVKVRMVSDDIGQTFRNLNIHNQQQYIICTGITFTIPEIIEYINRKRANDNKIPSNALPVVYSAVDEKLLFQNQIWFHPKIFYIKGELCLVFYSHLGKTTISQNAEIAEIIFMQHA